MVELLEVSSSLWEVYYGSRGVYCSFWEAYRSFWGDPWIGSSRNRTPTVRPMRMHFKSISGFTSSVLALSFFSRLTMLATHSSCQRTRPQESIQCYYSASHIMAIMKKKSTSLGPAVTWWVLHGLYRMGIDYAVSQTMRYSQNWTQRRHTGSLTQRCIYRREAGEFTIQTKFNTPRDFYSDDCMRLSHRLTKRRTGPYILYFHYAFSDITSSPWNMCSHLWLKLRKTVEIIAIP